MTDYEETQDPQEDWAGFSGAQTDIEDQSLHPATLTDLTRKMLPSQFDPSGRAPAIIWTFALEDIEGTTIDGTTSEATGPKSKARPWLEALIGKDKTKELLRGRIDKKVLIGRPCQVLVAINDNGYPKVSAVLPAQGARRTAPQAEPARDTTPPVSEPQGPSDALRDLVTEADRAQRDATLTAIGAVGEPERCSAFDTGLGRCVNGDGHEGPHKGKSGDTWR